MVNDDLQCELIVMACGICLKIHKKPRLFAVDCSPHEHCEHYTLFSAAIGAAMLHRQAAIR